MEHIRSSTIAELTQRLEGAHYPERQDDEAALRKLQAARRTGEIHYSDEDEAAISAALERYNQKRSFKPRLGRQL